MNIKWISSHLAFIGLSIGVGYVTYLLPAVWYLKLGLFGVICMVLIISFGFVSIRSIKQLANR